MHENPTKCCENIQERIEWYLLCYSSEGTGERMSYGFQNTHSVFDLADLKF